MSPREYNFCVTGKYEDMERTFLKILLHHLCTESRFKKSIEPPLRLDGI